MIAYDSDIDPPAPIFQITVAGIVGTGHRETVPALLDTGSDISAIPAGLTESLSLCPIGRLRLEDVEARTTSVFTYAVQLTAAGVVIPRLEVILTGLDFAVLGRDVLNRFYVLLNGPDLAFDLSASPFLSP